MKIAITSRRKIFTIQQEFSNLFPYLKVEFFPKPYGQERGSSKKIFISSSKSLSECRAFHNEGSITITPGMTVSELCQRFRDVYGLEVQVFRNSGKVWLETTLTEAWTLEEQNRQGEALTRTVN